MGFYADAERAREEERRAAEKFIAEHELGNIPPEPGGNQRFDTGESAGRQSVAPGRQREDDGLPRMHRDPTSLDSYPGGAVRFEEDHPEARFMVLGAAMGGLDYDEVDKRARMNHVYSFLAERQVDILRRWGIEGMTLEQMAAEDGVTKQAVHKRLTKARAAFMKAYEAHWNDETLTEEP
jgi:hypothetical protein